MNIFKRIYNAIRAAFTAKPKPEKLEDKKEEWDFFMHEPYHKPESVPTVKAAMLGIKYVAPANEENPEKNPDENA